MTPNWYNGRRLINELSLFHCQLSRIQPNAFDSEPFRHTNHLAIVNSTAITFIEGMFNGLSNLRRLQLRSTTIIDIDVDFMRPMAQRLNYLFIDCFVDSIRFVKTFGMYPLNALQTLNIHVKTDWDRVIGPPTFNQLTAIKLLDISHCSISIIITNTFDVIGKTLTHINLSYNRLKAIQASLFTVFFSTAKLKDHSILRISYNPIVCSCDFYETRNLTLLNTDYFYGSAEKFMKELVCRSGRPRSYCSNVQQIRAATLHRNETVLGTFALPKVIIRIFNGTLEIKTKTTSGIRLLVHIHRPSTMAEQSQKCHNIEWIRDSFKCFLLSERAMVIPVAEYLELSTPVTFYASLTVLISNRVWPLHCQTWQKGLDVIGRSNIAITISVISGFCLAGFLLGLLMNFVYMEFKKRRGKNMRKTQGIE